MPRSRGSEMPQRPSPRGPASLRTSSSDSDPTHHRSITDRSPKIGDRRSPRGSQSDPVGQKKLGTRIADLESQLGQAQDELKNLKEQLSSAEAEKKEAQEKLEKKKKPVEVKGNNKKNHPQKGAWESKEHDDLEETDVFEVPIEKMAIKLESETTQVSKVVHKDNIMSDAISVEHPSPIEKPILQELTEKDEEIKVLMAKLEEKEKETELVVRENESLKTQLNEIASRVLTGQAKEEDLTRKLSRVEEELETSQAKVGDLSERVKFMEEAKETLDAEMKKIRVQTEQWKKAADAAAAVLSGGVDMTGRIPERCGSMDKHYIGSGGGGYAAFMGSPADDLDDSFGSGKRKGSGIKMFGDLWKKKGSK